MEKSNSRCGKVAVDGDENLKVLIIEPRRIFEECLSYYLSQSSGIETVSIATVRAWPELVTHESPPDLILLCVAEGDRLPAEPSEVVMSIEELRSLPVIVMSNERPPAQVFSLLKAGFRGFIPTDVGCAVAAQVLRLVKAGGTFVPASSLSSSLPDEDAVGLDSGEMFTGRQRQVIEAIRLGKPNKLIAYELNMCESTVKVHVRTIMKKLKARNRTEVAYLYSSRVGEVLDKDDGLKLHLPPASPREN